MYHSNSSQKLGIRSTVAIYLQGGHMIDFVKLARESHDTAIEKGWWLKTVDGTPPKMSDEICALLHSEISEAVEELRNSKPPIYFILSTGEVLQDNEDIIDGVSDNGKSLKPEGVAVELADLLIRLGDSAQYWDVVDLVHNDLQSMQGLPPSFEKKTPVGCMADLHEQVSKLYNRLVLREITKKSFRDTMVAIEVTFIVQLALRICRTYGWDLNRAIKLKAAYNKTRPFRHGGKAA
jgi:hypothetical protein